MSDLMVAIAASVLSAGLTGLISAVLTAKQVAAVMDQKVADVTRRVGVLEEDKQDRSVSDLEHKRLDGRIDVVAGEVSRERHRINNIEQGLRGRL